LPRRNVESQEGESSEVSDDDEDAEDVEMGEGDEELSSIDGDLEDADISGLSAEDDDTNEIHDEVPELDKFIEAKNEKPERKRKSEFSFVSIQIVFIVNLICSIGDSMNLSSQKITFF